jgi:hypothetical protein
MPPSAMPGFNISIPQERMTVVIYGIALVPGTGVERVL